VYVKEPDEIHLFLCVPALARELNLETDGASGLQQTIASPRPNSTALTNCSGGHVAVGQFVRPPTMGVPPSYTRARRADTRLHQRQRRSRAGGTYAPKPNLDHGVASRSRPSPFKEIFMRSIEARATAR
jgi:hypothetical protein